MALITREQDKMDNRDGSEDLVLQVQPKVIQTIQSSVDKPQIVDSYSVTLPAWGFVKLDNRDGPGMLFPNSRGNKAAANLRL